jgi:hypothetical protein
VLLHPFSDQSGCVFFHKDTGETLSVNLTLDELLQLFVIFKQGQALGTEQQQIVQTLMHKQFIQLDA